MKNNDSLIQKDAGASMLVVEGLTKYFSIQQGILRSRNKRLVHAVENVSFSINKCETLGLVGESGCGKTTIGKLILIIERPTSGNIFFKGSNVEKLKGRPLKNYRRAVQAVFQDPYSSLNPRMKIQDILREPLTVHNVSKDESVSRVRSMLAEVGLQENMADRFPHEFSGGQRQRIAVARALALYPELIVLDEPVSALDVSLRSQIMNLLKELQTKHGHSYLLIAHSMAVIRYMSTKVAVMYLGQTVEYANKSQIFRSALHPYTKALFSAALPVRLDTVDDEEILEGEVPDPADPPSGCRFHTRCPTAREICRIQMPQLQEIEPGHYVACHLHQ